MHKPQGLHGALAAALAVLLLAGAGFLLRFAASSDMSQLLRAYLCLAAALLLFIGAFHGFARLWRHGPAVPPGAQTGASLCAAAVALCAAGYWLLPADPATAAARLCTACLEIALFFLCLRAGPLRLDRLVEMLALCLTTLVAWAYGYLPNALNLSFYSTHHANAVTQAIYNTAFHIPCLPETTSIYGRYHLFFAPFLQLLGHKPQTVGLLLGMTCLAAWLTYWRLLCRLTPNGVLRAVGLLADSSQLVSMLAQDHIYLQMFPLRQLWPLVVLNYLTAHYRRRDLLRSRVLLGGYLLCSLAILWNTDSGLVTTAAFTLCLWLFGWQQEGWHSPAMVRCYLKTIAGSLLSVAGMVALVNLYNLLCGGPLVFRSCFFPLLGSDYVVSALQTPLEAASAGLLPGWLLPVLLFLLCVGLGLSSTTLLRSAADRKWMPAAFVGVMALGQCYYFFNRPVAGTACVSVYMYVCMTALVGLVVEAWATAELGVSPRRILCGGVLAVCTMGLVTGSQLALTDGLPVLYIQWQSGRWTMDSLEALAAQVEDSVPRDTYAFGYYTQEVYAQLGWDPQYHGRDVSDMNTDLDFSRENGLPTLRFLEEICGQKTLLLQADALLETPLQVTTRRDIPQQDPVFYYWTP